MIEEKEYYEVICDKCGERLSLDGITAWQSEEDASDALNYCDWKEESNGHICCSSCADTDIDFMYEDE